MPAAGTWCCCGHSNDATPQPRPPPPRSTHASIAGRCPCALRPDFSVADRLPVHISLLRTFSPSSRVLQPAVINKRSSEEEQGKQQDAAGRRIPRTFEIEPHLIRALPPFKSNSTGACGRVPKQGHPPTTNDAMISPGGASAPLPAAPPPAGAGAGASRGGPAVGRPHHQQHAYRRRPLPHAHQQTEMELYQKKMKASTWSELAGCLSCVCVCRRRDACIRLDQTTPRRSLNPHPRRITHPHKTTAEGLDDARRDCQHPGLDRHMVRPPPR